MYDSPVLYILTNNTLDIVIFDRYHSHTFCHIFFIFLHQILAQIEISTSVWSVKHPNAGQIYTCNGLNGQLPLARLTILKLRGTRNW